MTDRQTVAEALVLFWFLFDPNSTARLLPSACVRVFLSDPLLSSTSVQRNVSPKRPVLKTAADKWLA